MSQKERANFSVKTKQAIAAAVNWQCSVPLCKNPAMGADNGSTINGGTACHIFSAAKNGPRGRGGLNNEELKDAGNGLWCCAYHGRVIDANQGASFPAAQLHMWKRLAEGRVRRAMTVQFAELGWIHEFSLSIRTSSGRLWEPSATFQKNNLLRGKSEAGKTLILEALASISANRHAWRLRQFSEFSIELTYETLTREGIAVVSCDGENPIQRSQSGAQTAIPPPDTKILYLPSVQDHSPKDHTSVRHLTRALGVDEDVLHGLARSVSSNPNSGMKVVLRRDVQDETDLTKETEEDDGAVFVTLSKHGFELPFNALSESEQTQVVGALLIALAREEVKSRPVLLCMDEVGRFDENLFQNELKMLAKERIQLLVVAPYNLSDEQALRDLPDWKIIDFASIREVLTN
ncbi:hypothetical protein [Achromobacter aegrifaciens]